MERPDAKEMIAMSVRDIDVGQVFTTCGNPVGEGAVLIDGQQRIDQDRVACDVNESR